ncbi:hypothetical protein AT248_04945 [Bartonella henselae]|nr:hypothetical protein AT237_06210 [Bartonella henselae]OLL46439.1 hypothetical protein AT242_07245 [Bartonella henselae]OLL59390.1 hypothetical protein AT248_04945 [Bartonella henselae]
MKQRKKTVVIKFTVILSFKKRPLLCFGGKKNIAIKAVLKINTRESISRRKSLIKRKVPLKKAPSFLEPFQYLFL